MYVNCECVGVAAEGSGPAPKQITMIFWDNSTPWAHACLSFLDETRQGLPASYHVKDNVRGECRCGSAGHAVPHVLEAGAVEDDMTRSLDLN
jgi:hypothetical protein